MLFVNATSEKSKNESNGIIRSRLLVRFLFLLQALAAYLTVLTFGFWSLGIFGKFHWEVTLRPLLARYRLDNERMLNAQTYYNRSCDRHDFSTNDFNDLIIRDEWDHTKAAENILTHGVSVFPKVIDRDLAGAFRSYILERNERLTPEEMVFVIKSKTKSKQTRWSFAFTSQDQPLIIPKVLEQIANHEKLVGVLELFLGKDPAIIKMQTITQSYRAEHQHWHPDTSAEASVRSHARDFMMHFSLFITLQDTTPRMGATGVCPGTQYCKSVIEYEYGCKQVSSGNILSTSQNGTNKIIKPGSWMAGDAVLMNQNTFHRGWEHKMHNGPDRAIIVLTFTSRPRSSNGKDPKHPFSTPLPSQIWSGKTFGNYNSTTIISSLDAKNFPIQSWADEKKKLADVESRVLSFGTPLSSFGFTMDDLKDSLSRMSKLFIILRFFGIYKPTDANWGWDYVTSGLSRMSADGHTFKKDDLSSWLGRQRKLIGKKRKSRSLSVRVQSILMQWYKKRILAGMPEAIEHVGIWDTWISLSLEKSTNYFQQSLCWKCMIYMIISILIEWNERKDRRFTFQGSLAKSFLRTLKGICVILLILVSMNWRLQSSTLVQDIRSGRKLRPAFPNMTAIMTSPGSISLLPTAGVRRITHGRGRVDIVDPTRYDILIGTRFDSLYLRIVNRFLDYHTGNRIWRELTREASLCSERGLFFSSDIVTVAVIDFILAKMKGALLLQTPETGEFISMTIGDSRIYTRRALILEHSPLISELDRSISFMISEMRFESDLRATPLALFGVGVLEDIREKIFEESDETRSHLFTESKKNRRKSGSETIPLVKTIRLRATVSSYIATLKPEEIEFHRKVIKDRERSRKRAASLEAARQNTADSGVRTDSGMSSGRRRKKRRSRAQARRPAKTTATQ